MYLLLSLFLISASFAQNIPGARQVSLCNSDAASSDDVFAIFNNPAGLPQIPWREAGIYYSPSPFGLSELKNGFIAYVEPTSLGAFAVGIMTYGYNLYHETKFLFSFSNQLYKDLFVGAALNYHYVSIERYGNEGSFYLNLGTLGYVTSDIRFGFNIINLTNATFGHVENQIPVTISSGLSINFSDLCLLHISLHKEVKFEYSLNAGIEYTIFNLLTLRSGISTVPLRYALGSGFHKNYFSFDYAFFMHRDLGITHQISLIFSFNEYLNRQKEIKAFLGLNND